MDGTSRSRTTNLLARRVAALVAAAVAFSCSAPALAADPATDFAPDSAPVQAAVELSKTYWQSNPCNGQVAIVWMTLTEQTNATSSWANPAGQYEHPELNTNCQIAFNKALAWDWTRFCSILVHEYGHLAGHSHADDAADVMYAFYEKPVDQCVAAAPAQPVAVADVVEAPPAVAAAVTPAADPASTRSVVASPKHKVKRGWIVRVKHTHRHRHGHRHRAHGHHLTKHQRLERAKRRAMRKWRAAHRH